MSILTTLFAKLDEFQQCGANHFLVALSGGLDSIALLHACCQYQQQHPELKLTATHVHHGLSPNANLWAKHCQAICDSWSVEHSVLKVDVPQGARISLEASAREQRYQALHNQLSERSLLLTAHHQDDQVETLLLALKRGSGLDGLSAMPELMPLNVGYHGRPLLSVSRSELELYANSNQLSWVEDESNEDEGFDRNFIRHSLMPLLHERWPGFSKAASRSVELLASQRQLTEELAKQDLAECLQANGMLVDKLANLSEARRDNTLRWWLREQGAPLWSQAQLEEAWNSVALAREDAQPKLQWQGWTLRRYQGVLSLEPPAEAFELPDLLWNWPEPLELPGQIGTLVCSPLSDVSQAGLRPPKSNEIVTIRFGLAGSLKVHPEGRSGSRPLKKVWQERGVAPWQRPLVPMVFFNETLVAAVGYWVEKSFVAEQGGSWLPTVSTCWQKL